MIDGINFSSSTTLAQRVILLYLNSVHLRIEKSKGYQFVAVMLKEGTANMIEAILVYTAFAVLQSQFTY